MATGYYLGNKREICSCSEWMIEVVKVTDIVECYQRTDWSENNYISNAQWLNGERDFIVWVINSSHKVRVLTWTLLELAGCWCIHCSEKNFLKALGCSHFLSRNEPIFMSVYCFVSQLLSRRMGLLWPWKITHMHTDTQMKPEIFWRLR